MTSFKDTTGRDWKIEWDGLLLEDVLSSTGVDLSDLSGGGLETIEQSAGKLVKVLSVLVRDQLGVMTAAQFSKVIKGDALTAAYAAVIEAAAAFFPQSVWSEIQQRLQTSRTFREVWLKLKPVMAKLSEPEAEPLRAAILGALTELIGTGDLQRLQELASAGGQPSILSPPATDSPGKSASAHAA